MSPSDILDKARSVLAGEPARAIGYGAAVIVYLVARASGSIDDIPLDDAVILTAGYVTTVAGVIESIRKFVYSPASVAAIVLTPPTAEGPIAAAEEAGVDVAAAADAAAEDDTA